ncbi:MAG: polyprenol monophosphomannose synthase [Candidatus Micrarchaeia archaeon]
MLSIIIPIYNEAANVKELVARISKSLGRQKYEIIFVDDGSTDGTGRIIRDIALKDKRIIYMNRGAKMGLSSAVMDGLKRASGEYVCVMDGDLQHDPAYLRKMYSIVKKHKDPLVIGSRFIKNLNNPQRADSKLGTLICRYALGINVHDPLSGFFMLRRDSFQKLAPKINPIGYKILLEILAKGRFSKIIEVPIVFHMRGKGSSKLDLKTRTEFLKQVAGLVACKK